MLYERSDFPTGSGGLVRRDVDFIAKFVENVERSGVTLTEAYTDAPGTFGFWLWKPLTTKP
ncbi:MAG TPA: hypothetical protein VF393_04595 [archaeon]|jgi:hypothetical protein